jgi:imidazolonepropionase-like amidohydrolase
MRRPILAWALVLAAAGVQPAAAQNEVTTPRSYALTNARIVVSPGTVIEQGTIVVREGRITAVGANAQVPAGVIRLDLGGATVYAGLIDAANGAGLPTIAAGGRGGGGGGEAASSGPPAELNPGVNAVDAFTPGGDLLSNYRAAGVTTVGLAFSGGIFPGRVSAVSTRDGMASAVVLRSPVAQQVAFGRKRGGYPSTLMGVLAYIEQSFKDARYDARARAAFETSPGSSPLPPYDAEHEALQAAAAGELPVWFAASGAYDIERVIDLAAKLGVEDWAIVGGQEAFKVAQHVRAAGKPMILSLDFPNPDQMTGRSFEAHVAPASGDDTADEQADSAAAKMLRGNAAALASAGVPFALSGMGVSSPAEFRRRLVTIVEEGLSADDALRALTVTPAQVLGLSGALGTIEAGKLANLVVVEGDLFDEDARIAQVFVQGEKYDIPRQPAGGAGRGGRGGDAGGDAVTAAGEWNGSMDMQGQAFGFTLTITGQNDALSATLATEMGATTMRGDMADGRLSLNGLFESQQGQIPISLNAQVTASEMTGTLDIEGMGTVSMTARRGGAAAGRSHAIKDGGNG